MKTLLLLHGVWVATSFLGLNCAYADTEQPLHGVHVQAIQPETNVSEFQKQGATIDAGNSKVVSKSAAYPFTSPQRDEWINKSGLVSSVKKWDQYSKDELIIRAITLEDQKLVEQYPRLKSAQLLALKKIATQEARASR